MLTRGAVGDRGKEAAVALLVEAGVLRQVKASIVVDTDKQSAVIDWVTLQNIAGHASGSARAVLRMSLILAYDSENVHPSQHQAMRRALDHVTPQQVERQDRPLRRRPPPACLG